MLHPQAEAAISLWSQGPRVSNPGYGEAEISAQRQQALEDAAVEPKEPVAEIEEVDAGGVHCRLYRPEGSAPGVIVHLHGGGFVFGDLDTHDAHCRRLANRAGCAVFAVAYRRPPEHRFPAAPDDVDSALSWLADNGSQNGLDLSRMVSLGDSAGANLALVAALRNPGVFAALVLVYPFLDPGQQFVAPHESNDALSKQEAAWYWQQYAPSEDQSLPDLAPMQSPVLGSLPPTLVIAAEHDLLRGENEELVRRIARAGAEVQLTTYPGMVHGFYRHPALFDAAEEALAQITDFLHNVIRLGSASDHNV